MLSSVSTFNGLYFDAGGRCKADRPEPPAIVSLQQVLQKKSATLLQCSLPGSLIPGALRVNSLYLLLLNWALFYTGFPEQERRQSFGHFLQSFFHLTTVLS